jgi:hypothetical protein
LLGVGRAADGAFGRVVGFRRMALEANHCHPVVLRIWRASRLENEVDQPADRERGQHNKHVQARGQHQP